MTSHFLIQEVTHLGARSPQYNCFLFTGRVDYVCYITNTCFYNELEKDLKKNSVAVSSF